MARILIVIAIACAATSLALVYYSPIQIGKVDSSADGKLESQQPEEDPSSKKDSSSSNRSSRRKKAENPSQSAGADSMESNSPGVAGNQSSSDDSDPLHSVVTKDSTAVHSLNSPASSVVDYLKKGDRVTSDLEVIQADGRWSLIRGEEQTGSGYVRSENLQLKQTPNRERKGDSKRGTKRARKQ